jgi:hypothetical protein
MASLLAAATIVALVSRTPKFTRCGLPEWLLAGQRSSAHLSRVATPDERGRASTASSKQAWPVS